MLILSQNADTENCPTCKNEARSRDTKRQAMIEKTR